jgi:hypothetical protein
VPALEPVRRYCHAKLKPGEYKRVPKPTDHPPGGYYIACPVCGYVMSVRTKFLNNREGLVVEEKQGELFKLGQFCCRKCRKSLSVEGGRYVIA